MDHLLIVPILLPLVTGALLLIPDERRKRLKSDHHLGAGPDGASHSP